METKLGWHRFTTGQQLGAGASGAVQKFQTGTSHTIAAGGHGNAKEPECG